MLLLPSSIIKMVAEIALFALTGQSILGFVADVQRETNFVYRLWES